MGLLYEVYTLPWDSGGFVKKFFWLPVEGGSGTGTVEFLTSTGEGSVNVYLDKLEEAGRDLTEIVSDTTSSLIRVIDCLPDGTRTIIDEWVCERPARVHDDARKVTISGPKLKAKAFDSQTIPAFDSPANPSVNPDHIWGGDNILSDPGFENANKQNEEYEIDLDGATGGSFILHLNGNNTNSIPFDTSIGNLENEVEALPGVTDVLVDEIGKGFRIEFHNPISPEREGLGLLTWTPSLTGTDGDESLNRTNDGQILPSASWTRSQYSDASSSPNSHGTYASDGYRLTEGSEPVRSGEFAGRINGLTQFAGIQQLVRVQPSTRHQASIWFYSSDGTEEFRLVMRDRYENLIAWQNIANLTPGTWTEVTLDFVTELAVDGTPVSEMIFRFAQIIDHNPSPFYVDDAALEPGAPVSTWGEIVNVLMGLKTTEFDWIDHSTVTDSLDSGGVAWPRDESVTAFFGESYGQFWDKGVDLEYEWDLQPKATPSGSLTHDLVWYGPGGLDTTPSAGIYPNASVTGGDSLTRTPAFTKVIVEGADGRYVEAEDAAAVAAFGELEKYVKDTSLHSDESLNARASGLLNYEAANRNAVHFQMVEHATLPRPGTHFKPGDTIPMQLPPGLEKTNKRVQSFSYTNSFPTQYLVTGSRVLSGEAAAYSLLWRLWRRFENPIRDKGGGGFAAGSGGIGAIDVAASDAPSWEKAVARYQCDGVNDEVEIQAAIDEGWEVTLSSGTFNISSSIQFQADTSLVGMGRLTTNLIVSAAGITVITTSNNNDIRNLGISWVSGGKSGTGINVVGSNTAISNIWFQDLDVGVAVVASGFNMSGCYMQGVEIAVDGSSSGGITLGTITGNVLTGGILLEDATNKLVIAGNTMQDVGVFLTNAEFVTIAGNTWHGSHVSGANDLLVANGAGAVTVDGNLIYCIGYNAPEFTNCVAVTVTNNQILNSNMGLSFTTTDYIQVVGNIIGGDPNTFGFNSGSLGEHGILLDTCDHAHITNNFIVEPGEDVDNTYDGIQVSGNSNRVTDNTVIPRQSGSATRYGINIVSGQRNIVVGNSLGDSAIYGTDALNNSGEGTRLTYPNDATYGDNFTNESLNLVRVKDEASNISESDLHFLA